MTARRRGEEGYAIVAAVASIGVFATMALMALSAAQLSLADVGAEQGALQAGASADAGIAIALKRLLAEPGDRWPLDPRIHDMRFGTAQLRIRIEDERGKVPLNMLNDKLATRLLERVGLEGDRLRIAHDSLLDWLDSDDEPHPFGAESDYYANIGLRPANGFVASIDELRSIRGFDTATIERLRPLVTASVSVAGFDPSYANPDALAIMQDAGEDSPVAIERAREQSGQRTAIEFTTDDITGRPLTIAVEARLPDGSRAVRRALVELTGTPAKPYLVEEYR